MSEDFAKKAFGVFVVFMIIATVIRFLIGGGDEPEHRAKPLVQVHMGQQIFSLEVSKTNKKRRRGLMHRTDLVPCGGMVFYFPKPRKVRFWMKNTPAPLWIGFIDVYDRVVHIEPRTIPFSTERFGAKSKVNRVIEVHADCPKLTNVRLGETITLIEQ